MYNKSKEVSKKIAKITREEKSKPKTDRLSKKAQIRKAYEIVRSRDK